MKRHDILPVAQPQSYGTTVSQSSIYIPAPTSASPIRAVHPRHSIREFDYLTSKHRGTSFQPQLESLISMPVLVWKDRSAKDWTRFAQEISNRAIFTQASEAGIIHIQDGEFYREKFNVSKETADTLCFFTKLYLVLGQLGRTDIPIALDGEYRKQSSPGGKSGQNFVCALQGFLPNAHIGFWHKRLINDWINRKLPESDWLPDSELYPCMRVATTMKASSGEAPAKSKSFEESLANGFTPHQLAELLSKRHLAFYDTLSKRAYAKPGQWASFYWAMRSMGYVQIVSSDIVPELIAASFNAKMSKSSLTSIYRKEVVREGCKPIANTETARICGVIKGYLSDK